MAGLTSISKESKDKIRLILKALQDNHYLKIEKVRGEKEYFEYKYLIYKNKFGYLKEPINANIRRMHIDINNFWKFDAAFVEK